MEQFGFQENLAVGDGNHVGGDVGRHVARLGFNQGQGGDGASAVLGRHAGRTLQQAGVQVEHVAGIRLASRRTADQQRQGAVGHGVLAQVVVDDQHVLALLTEILGHGAAGIGRDVLQRRAFRSGGGHDDGIGHGPGALQFARDLHHVGILLTDGHIDAQHAVAALVDDGVNGDGALGGLTVTNDQLTLAAADGNHGVNGLDARLQGHRHTLALDDAGRLALDGAGFGGGDVALAVDGLAQGVHYAAKHCLAHGHGQGAAGAVHRAALMNIVLVGQDGDGNRLFLQVLGHAEAAVLKAEQLVGHAGAQAVHPGNTVSHGDHSACFRHFHMGFVIADLLLQDAADFLRLVAHLFITSLISCSRCFRLPSITLPSTRITRPPSRASSTEHSMRMLRPSFFSRLA